MQTMILRWIACAVICGALPALADQPTGSAQPKLETRPIKIGDVELTVEVADENAEREKGLMFRKELKDGEGMLFVMDAPEQTAFWMRNTMIPLSIAYVNPAGVILEIHDLQPLNERPVESRFSTILYAIEVPQGWFSRNGIYAGTQVTGLPMAPAPR